MNHVISHTKEVLKITNILETTFGTTVFSSLLLLNTFNEEIIWHTENKTNGYLFINIWLGGVAGRKGNLER